MLHLVLDVLNILWFIPFYVHTPLSHPFPVDENFWRVVTGQDFLSGNLFMANIYKGHFDQSRFLVGISFMAIVVFILLSFFLRVTHYITIDSFLNHLSWRYLKVSSIVIRSFISSWLFLRVIKSLIFLRALWLILIIGKGDVIIIIIYGFTSVLHAGIRWTVFRKLTSKLTYL